MSLPVSVILSCSADGEYGQWKIGHRSESITFSVQTFVVKLATGLASGVVGIGLAIVGFKPDLVQEMSTVYGMSVIMFIIPIFVLLVALYVKLEAGKGEVL